MIIDLPQSSRPDSRTLEGPHLGENNQRLDFTVVAALFSIPYDKQTLGRVLDQITKVHIAEEPVVYVSEIWVRSAFKKGVKDSEK